MGSPQTGSRPSSPRQIVVLTQGYSNPITAKTGANLIRYAGEEVIAVLDAEHAGKRAVDLLGVGESIPVVASLHDVPHANTMLIGTAPTGGRIPEAWREIVLDAICRGLNIISGLHDFLGDDPRLAAAARDHGVTIKDVRRNDEQQVASGLPLGNSQLRVHTVGHDCSVGKMIAALEVARGLQRKGHDAKFLATGQTGIMIAGEGVPIDRVIADFVSGAAEQLVIRNQHHKIVMIEGQGSLAHPMYAAVTLGLLHGCQPHGLIMCYEAGRTMIGSTSRPIPELKQLRATYEMMAAWVQPTEFIGVALNGRRMNADESDREKDRVIQELGLPICDVFRDGPDLLVQAVEDLGKRLTICT